MTDRTLPEWIGKTADTAIPPRVKLRLIDGQGGKCASCVRNLGLAGEPIEFDHIIALINGGENREANLQALCPFCHRGKTAEDVAEKSTVARKRKKALGLTKTRFPLPGSRGSKWKRKIGGGVVRRDEE